MRRCPTTLGVWLAATSCAEVASAKAKFFKSVTIPIPDNQDDNHNRNVTLTSLSGFPRHAYAAEAGAAISVLTPSPAGLVKASEQARRAHCRAAVNGGPFHADGTSLGVLVVDGQVRQAVDDDKAAALLVGVGKVVTPPSVDNNVTSMSWILGAPPDSLSSLDFYVTGFGWLVYNHSNVAPSKDNTGAKRAPRTAVGVQPDGRLVFIVVDGCEKW